MLFCTVEEQNIPSAGGRIGHTVHLRGVAINPSGLKQCLQWSVDGSEDGDEELRVWTSPHNQQEPCEKECNKQDLIYSSLERLFQMQSGLEVGQEQKLGGLAWRLLG